MLARVFAPAAVVLLVVPLAGCDSAKPSVFGASEPDDAGSGKIAASDAGVTSGSSGGGGSHAGDGGSLLTIDDGEAPVVATVLYAHDDTTLYRIDPTDPTLAAASLGAFDCIGGNGPAAMTNIAIDGNLNLFGVATSTLFLDMQIATGGVACAAGAVAIAPGAVSADDARFYGASFAPRGTLDPDREALVVGNDGGAMYVVDPLTGALTIVGTFGTVPADDGNANAYPSGPGGGSPGSIFQLSGDIVFVDNGGSPLGFATVRDCASASVCSAVDTLVELDLGKMVPRNTGPVVKAVRGQLQKAATCGDTSHSAYGSMYGIAAYEDRIIGFSHDGFVVSIQSSDGTACLVHDYSGTIAFNGAGVTTGAPVLAPPPK